MPVRTGPDRTSPECRATARGKSWPIDGCPGSTFWSPRKLRRLAGNLYAGSGGTPHNSRDDQDPADGETLLQARARPGHTEPGRSRCPPTGTGHPNRTALVHAGFPTEPVPARCGRAPNTLSRESTAPEYSEDETVTLAVIAAAHPHTVEFGKRGCLRRPLLPHPVPGRTPAPERSGRPAARGHRESVESLKWA